MQRRAGIILQGESKLRSSDTCQITVISDSESRTVSIGRSIGEVIRLGDALLLHGEMGAGKTCLTRGVALGAECEVSARSPTFIILAEYPGRVRVFHCDLYRISGASEVYELALDETLDRGALVVEWPENAEGELPHDALEIFLEPKPSTEQREITMSAKGVKSRSLLTMISDALNVEDKR